MHNIGVRYHAVMADALLKGTPTPVPFTLFNTNTITQYSPVSSVLLMLMN